MHGGKGKFGDVVAVVEAKCAFDLVVCGALAHFSDIGIKGRGKTAVDKLSVGEDESLLHIEADGNDVESVLHGEAMGLF